MTLFRRTLLPLTLCSATLLVAALAGCSSSGGKGGDKLSRADFIAQADAACASTLAKIKAAPTPTSLTDYQDILSYDAIGLREEPAFLAKVTGLVDRSTDAAALHKNWIDVDSADFAAQKPLIDKMDAAASSKNSAQVTAVANQLSALPDHTATEAKYLTSYGLTDCAALENFGND